MKCRSLDFHQFFPQIQKLEDGFHLYELSIVYSEKSALYLATLQLKSPNIDVRSTVGFAGNFMTGAFGGKRSTKV